MPKPRKTLANIVKFVLQDEFIDRKIHYKEAITLSIFEDLDECKCALNYLSECGNICLLHPVRDFGYPDVVRYFWQQVDLRGKNDIFFLYHNKKVTITAELIAEALGNILEKPKECSLGDPSSIAEIPKQLALIVIIGNGMLSSNNSILRGTLKCRKLIFLNAIIKTGAFCNGHDRERRFRFVHALFDPHHD